LNKKNITIFAIVIVLFAAMYYLLPKPMEQTYTQFKLDALNRTGTVCAGGHSSRLVLNLQNARACATRIVGAAGIQAHHIAELGLRSAEGCTTYIRR
jgi:hypothetical protein